MICNVFYDYCKKSVPEYKLSEEYFFYFVSNLLYDNSKDLAEIGSTVAKSFGCLYLNRKHLGETLDKYFVHDPDKFGTYSLNEKERKYHIYLENYKRHISEITKECETVLITKIASLMIHHDFNITESLPYMFALIKKQAEYPEDLYYSKYYNILYNYDSIEIKLDCSISKINESYLILPVSLVFHDKTVNDVLLSANIRNIKELIELSLSSLITLFSFSIDANVKIFDNMQKDRLITFKEDINKFFSQFPAEKIQIVKERHSLKNQKAKTLAEVADEFGLTRERIRQIQKATEKSINMYSSDILNEICCLYFFVNKNHAQYVQSEEMLSFIKNDEIFNEIVIILDCTQSSIAYESETEVFYDTSITSIEALENSVCIELGDYCTFDNYNQLNSFEKKIVDKKYRIIKGICFIHNGKRAKDLLEIVLDDIFSDGYSISDKKDYSKLKMEYENRFGSLEEFPNQHAIATMLTRINYIQIGRGLYKNSNYCPSLSDEFLDKIINYILINQPSVYYNSIYEHFKNEFNQLGINNAFYAKGVIDEKLPKDFNTKRSYISTTKNTTSSSESVINYFRAFSGEFTLAEIENKFEGVKDYVFYNYLYNEVNNGLIWITSSNFIYIDKIGINDNTVERLNVFVKNLFLTLGSETITSAKIYGRMSIIDKELLDDLKIVDNQFSMFSLVHVLFNRKYYFSRPFISLNENASATRSGVITNYVEKLDSFNHSTLNKFISKMNIGGLYSYLDFMEDMSDEFVQISVDTMIKKSLFIITDDQLKTIQNKLSLIFDRFNTIQTDSFNGYSMLPKLQTSWNKYLLVGIIRTYFGKNYEVEHTNNTYDSTEFIIRRIK